DGLEIRREYDEWGNQLNEENPHQLQQLIRLPGQQYDRNGRRCWPTQWSKPTTGSSAVSTVLRSVFAMQRSQTKRGWCVTP
ncbi:hypothetical protein, partial [Escherichia coli]|uniref:hypothetical protein n=1 Tax=Escherichia coli TaxID=562 RepID=UPI00387E19A5